MKRNGILISAALALFPGVAMAAGVNDALETVDYTGRLMVAGQTFNGKGNFKFALLERNGARIWTNGDNEPPIEEGVPSASARFLESVGFALLRNAILLAGALYLVRVDKPSGPTIAVAGRSG